MTDRATRVVAFRALHDGPGAFVMPNPYDAGVRAPPRHGGLFRRLPPPARGPRFALAVVTDRCRATKSSPTPAPSSRRPTCPSRPTSATVLGRDPETVAETIRAAAEAGLAGGSVEDVVGKDGTPLIDESLAVARVAAAAEAAGAVPGGFVLTARAEAHLFPDANLDATIRRLIAFAEAGADVLYAPGLPSLDVIRAVCAGVPRPVNVLVNPRFPGLTVAALAEAGARRISVGAILSRVALAAVHRAAVEMRAGNFEYLAELRSAPDPALAMRG